MRDGGRYRVRALDRALTILHMLNQHNGLNASELSRLVQLPRPTVLRLLQTLSVGGYVLRSDADGNFRASRKVRELSSGFQEEAWLHGIVRPFLSELANDLVWPLAVVKLYGHKLIVEALTDHASQMVVRRDSPGIEVPVLSSASGFVYMALASADDGRKLLAHALQAETAVLKRTGMSEPQVLELIGETRERGYAALHLATHSAVSAPVRLNGELICALNLRIHASPAARRANLGHYIPALQDAADQLSAQIGLTSRLRLNEACLPA